MAYLTGMKPFRRSKKAASRPAVLKPSRQPAKQPTGKAAIKKVSEMQTSQLKHEEKRTPASAKHMKTEPVEARKVRSGGRVGGRTTGNATRVPKSPDVLIPLKGATYHGNFSSKAIEFQDEVSPPGPIRLEYEVRQTGNPTALNQYKKMYKGSTYELPSPALTVGGTESYANNRMQAATTAGWGRSNVHWPYAWNDYAATTSNDIITSQTACFTRTQIENSLRAIFKDSIIPPTIESFIDQLQQSTGGDQRIDFPLDYIECEYKFFNDNISIPIELSLYLCVPNRNLTRAHNPMYDWFQPFCAQPTQNLMLPDYVYDPVLTAASDVIMQLNAQNQVSGSNLGSKSSHVMTMSTEVVPEATPHGFSERFRRNWDVKMVKPVILQPQQELILTLKVKMSKLLDWGQFFSYYNTGEKFELFKDLSIFPMVKFRGIDTTGVSKRLSANPGAAKQNRFIETTAPRSGPSMLSSSMRTMCRSHTKAALPRGMSGDLFEMLDAVAVSKRDLFPYNSVERGVNCPYYQVNDNIEYFGPTPTAGSTTYYTTVVNLGVKAHASIGSCVPTTDGDIFGSASTLLPVVNSKADWNVIDINTITRNILMPAESDISPPNP